MAHCATTQPTDPASGVQPPIAARNSGLRGKRAAMVTFSLYPGDPRPRRAVDALVGEGMSVDLVCLGSGNAPKRERLNGIQVFPIALKTYPTAPRAYPYPFPAFTSIS